MTPGRVHMINVSTWPSIAYLISPRHAFATGGLPRWPPVIAPVQLIDKMGR